MLELENYVNAEIILLHPGGCSEITPSSSSSQLVLLYNSWQLPQTGVGRLFWDFAPTLLVIYRQSTAGANANFIIPADISILSAFEPRLCRKNANLVTCIEGSFKKSICMQI